MRDKYIVFDPYDGDYRFEDFAGAERHAESFIEASKEAAYSDDEIDDDVEFFCIAKITHVVKIVDGDIRLVEVQP